METLDKMETFTFQAEINQLLSLIIHTFYSNKDIFLRELVSNASDALDKVRHQSLTDPGVLCAEPDLKINIQADKANSTLTITDTGVGMTKDELIANLGTIAKSGTKAFMEALKASAPQDAAGSPQVSLIGQFGVGFYSAYLVADTVTVISKSNSEETGHVWTSNANGSFTVRAVAAGEADDLKRGTRIILHLKEEAKDYAESSKLREILNKHCEFIDFGIQLQVERTEEVTAEEEEEEDDTEKGDEKEGEISEVTDVDAADGNGNTKKITKKMEWETVNKQKPIWLRKPDSIDSAAYAAFYKSLSNDWEDPLTYKHFSTEGAVVCNSILFCPKRVPMDMLASSKRNNVKLYVKRVFITDQCEELLPEYLSFIKGVVDSDDLPLNISREMLQQNRIIKSIGKNLVKRSIDMIQDLATNNADDYKTFYAAFSKNIKLGIHEDQVNRDKLLSLLRYSTSVTTANPATADVMVSLKEYVQRMKEGQDAIYYITGESQQVVSCSPFLENLKRKGCEVLFMTDPIDEYVMQQVRTYDDKRFVCCTKEEMKPAAGDAFDEDTVKRYEPVCKRIQDVLGQRVSKVVLSSRMVESPCALVTSTYSWSANMERIMKAQAMNHHGNDFGANTSKIMEINPKHRIVLGLQRKLAQQDKGDSDLIILMYEAAMLSSGFSLEKPSVFSNRIYRMMEFGLDLNDDSESDEGKEGEDGEDGEEGDDGEKGDAANEVTTLMEEVD